MNSFLENRGESKGANRVSILSLGLGLATVLVAPNMALAQMEEIIVTARKKEESLQSVPLSITAFSSDLLESKGIQSLGDMAGFVPGLEYFDFGGGALGSPVIRGLTQTNSVGIENNVGVFWNGVYVPARSGIDVDMLDLERTEVVRGPQNALYGRSTFAGAINYVAAAPTDKLLAKGTLSAGGDNLIRGQAIVSGPLIEDAVAFRLAVGLNNRDGTWKDKANGATMGGYKRQSVQGTARFTPSDQLAISVTGFYGNDDYEPISGADVTLQLGNNCAFRLGFNQAYCGTLPDGKDLDPQTPNNPFETAADRDLFFVTGRLTYNMDWASLDLLSGYSSVENFSYREFNFRRNGLAYNLTPAPGTVARTFFFGNAEKRDEWSQEVRLTSAQQQRLRWSFGGYYADNDGLTRTPVGGDGDPIPAGRTAGTAQRFITVGGAPSPLSSASSDAFRNYAAFGGLEFDLTDQFTANADLRYNYEKKALDQIRNFNAGGTDPDGAGLADSWRFVDPRISLEYKPSDALLFYVSAARGSKSGGFNSSASFAIDFSYGPETNWTYELGGKTSWMDNRVVLNATVYHIDWQDLQIPVANSDPNNPANVVKNFASAKNTGLELEFQADVNKILTLSGALALDNSRFGGDARDFTRVTICAVVPSCASSIVTVTTPQGARQAINLKGFSLQRTADTQLSASAALKDQLANTGWDWFARADYAYSSGKYTFIDNLAKHGDRNLLNTRVGVSNDRWDISAWVRNALDDTTSTVQYSGQSLFNTNQSSVDLLLPERRVWGLTVSVRM